MAWMEKLADATRDLRTYLGLYVRPELLEGVNLSPIMKQFADYVSRGQRGNDIDPDNVLDDVVDDLAKLDTYGGRPALETLTADLRTQAEHLNSLTEGEAERIVLPHKTLTDEDRKKLPDVAKSLTKIIADWVRQAVLRRAQGWLYKHRKDVRIKEKREPVFYDKPGKMAPHQDEEKEIVPEWEKAEDPIHEELSEYKEESKWMTGLIDTVRQAIKDGGIPGTALPGNQAIYMDILDQIFLAEKHTPLQTIADKHNTTAPTVMAYRDRLARLVAKMIKDWHPSKAILKTREEEKTQEKGRTGDVPDYVEYLKGHSDRIKDLKEHIQPNSRWSDFVKQEIDLYAEGHSDKEVADVTGRSITTVRGTRSRYFMPAYRAWYLETKGDHMASVEALLPYGLVHTSAVKRMPYEPEDGQEDLSPSETPAHRKMVEQALVGASKRLSVTVYFHADYDNLDKHEKNLPHDDQGQPVPVAVHFGYEKYIAHLHEEQSFGKTSYKVDYEYTRDLNDDGSFKGPSSSWLKLNSKSSAGELKQDIDTYVEKKVVPMGLIPKRPLVKGTHDQISVDYQNTKTGKNYPSIKALADAFNGLADWEDPKHKEFLHQYDMLQEKKKAPAPPSGGSEAVDARMKLNRIRIELEKEIAKAKDLQDWAKVEILKKQYDEAEQLYEDVKKKREKHLDKVHDFIQEEMQELEHIKCAEDFVMDEKIAAIFPAPGEGVKKVVDWLTSHGQKASPNPRLWLSAADLIVLARTFKALMVHDQEKALEELKKKKGLNKDEKAAEEQRIHLQYQELHNGAVKAFEEFPEDLKARREEMKKGKEYASWEESMKAARKDPAWVDDAHKVEDVKNKMHTILREWQPAKPVQQRSVKMLELSKFTGVKSFLENELTGLDTIGQALVDAPLQPEAGEEKISKVRAEIDATEGRIKDLSETVTHLVHDITEKGRAYQENVKQLMGPTKKQEYRSLYDIKAAEEEVKPRWQQEHRTSPWQRPPKAKPPIKEDTGPQEEAPGKVDTEELEQTTEQMRADLDKQMDALVGLQENIKPMAAKISQLRDQLRTYKVPAIAAAKALDGKLSYVSSLYSYMTGLLPFMLHHEPHRYHAATAVEAVEEHVLSEVEKLRSKIVSTTHRLSGFPFSNEDSIRKVIGEIKAMIPDFIDAVNALQIKKADVSVYGIVTAETVGEQVKEKGGEGAFKMELSKYIEDAKKVIEKLGEEAHDESGRMFRNKKKGVLQQKAAQAELDAILENVEKAFKPPEDSRVKELAGKWGIAFAPAKERLQKVRVALAKKALDEFHQKWTKIEEEGHAREKSPLGNKPASHYEVMNAFVAKHIPDLAHLTTPVTDPEAEYEEPKPRVPSAEELKRGEQYVLEHMMAKHKRGPADQYDLDKPQKEDAEFTLEKWIEDFYTGVTYGDESYPKSLSRPGDGGGGGGSGRSHPKEPKTPPPRLVPEQILSGLASKLKGGDNPKEIVLWEMGNYVVKVRDAVEEIKKNGGWMDPADVVDVLVHILKDLAGQVKNLRVEPPKWGAPKVLKSRDVTDIPINSFAEAERIYDKIVKLFQVINHYIKPDEVGVPPEKLSEMRKLFPMLPEGLTAWAPKMEIEEHGEGPQKPGDKPFLRKETVPPSEAQKMVERGSPHPSFTGKAAMTSVPMSVKVAEAFVGKNVSADESTMLQ